MSSAPAPSSSFHAAAAPPGTPGTRLRVLLVEDDPVARDMTAEMLHLLGHWTASVSSAEAARDRYLDGAFDVLMCDVGLPGLSGLDLVQSLHPPGVALLMVSGGRRPATLPPGCAWLAKPYGLDALARVLAQLCPPAAQAVADAQPRVAEGGTGTSSGPTAGVAGTGGMAGALDVGAAWGASTGTGALAGAGGT